MRRISVSGMEQSSDPDIFISLFNERLFIIHDHFIASILSAAHRGCATINRWIKGGHTFWFTVCATYGWINNDLIYVYDRHPLVRGIDNDLRYVAIGNLSRVSLCLTIRRSWSIDASDYVTSRNKRKLGNREVRVEKLGFKVLATKKNLTFNGPLPWHLERHRECNTVPRKSSTELIYEIVANPRNMIYYLSETFLLFLFFFNARWSFNHLAFVIKSQLWFSIKWYNFARLVLLANNYHRSKKKENLEARKLNYSLPLFLSWNVISGKLHVRIYTVGGETSIRNSPL